MNINKRASYARGNAFVANGFMIDKTQSRKRGKHPRWRASVKVSAFKWNESLASVAGTAWGASHTRVEFLAPKLPEGGTKPWSDMFPRASN